MPWKIDGGGGFIGSNGSVIRSIFSRMVLSTKEA
jgi:hypothetical protein